MKSVIFYALSVVTFLFGGVFATGAIRVGFMALLEIVLSIRYPSRENWERTAGDILGAVIAGLIAWLLLKGGKALWTKARSKSPQPAVTD